MTEKTVSSLLMKGTKAGMSRVFSEDGQFIPVTIVYIEPSYIAEISSESKVKIAYKIKKKNLVNKPTVGILKKAGIALNCTKFFEVEKTNFSNQNPEIGSLLKCSIKAGDFIDVTGTTKGKGFQGVIKKYGFSGGPGAHGSQFHRTTGSIGNRATPARVFKNKKMPGHMGCERVTVQNLLVVAVDEKINAIVIKGAVPGFKGSELTIKPTKKIN